MKLDKYDVAITISVPGDEETSITVTLRDVPREKVSTVKVPLAGLLEQFEEGIIDDDCR